MSKIPPAMKQNRRFVDAHFVKTEYLYRRVPLDYWADAGDDLDVNAVELPDMSCGRSKYGHPEWLRLDVRDNGVYIFRDGWGVIGFQIGDVPPERWDDGILRFTFSIVHEPDEWNYPHSEIRAFDGGVRIDVVEKLPELMHLEWRELLLREARVFLKPNQNAKTRDLAPKSHVPELPIPAS